MALTGPTAGTNFGTDFATTQINVTNATHPIMAGFTQGTATVEVPGGGLAWGQPASGATILATEAGQAGRATLFAFDQGATLADRTAAPHRRVAIFQGSDTTTTQGWEIFDNAVRWAVGARVPALFVPGSTTLTTSDSAVKARLENEFGFSVTVKQ